MNTTLPQRSGTDQRAEPFWTSLPTRFHPSSRGATASFGTEHPRCLGEFRLKNPTVNGPMNRNLFSKQGKDKKQLFSFLIKLSPILRDFAHANESRKLLIIFFPQ